tara:strand:+ start:189278 stop:189757 length:480 start_codon:yes stop_codon:yes gene_type:complete
MKKVVLVIVIVLFGFSVQAQEGFKLGANIGLPIGDAGDLSSFSIGLDVAYMFEVSDSFDAGIVSGFSHAFLKDGLDGEVQFLPIAASGRFKAADKFSIGADLGYAMGINDGNDGGFYYRPIAGYNISEKVQLNLSYTGISANDADFSWSTINLGVLFSL